MRYVFCLFVLLLLPIGCARTVYLHDTKSAADFARDQYECQIAVAQHATMQGLDPFLAQVVGDDMARCLSLRHGWRVQARLDSPAGK